jgi:phosphoglycolate phosphatase
MTERVIAALFPPGRFAAVAGQRPGVPMKPDPAAALAIAAELGVPPAACAFVGDSGVDVATARAAGMVALGVTWGYRPRAELEAAGATAILDDVAALGRLLDRLAASAPAAPDGASDLVTEK